MLFKKKNVSIPNQSYLQNHKNILLAAKEAKASYMKNFPFQSDHMLSEKERETYELKYGLSFQLQMKANDFYIYKVHMFN